MKKKEINWDEIPVMVDSIIYVKEDDKGNIKYYTTHHNMDHGWLCEIDNKWLVEIEKYYYEKEINEKN